MGEVWTPLLHKSLRQSRSRVRSHSHHNWPYSRPQKRKYPPDGPHSSSSNRLVYHVHSKRRGEREGGRVKTRGNCLWCCASERTTSGTLKTTEGLSKSNTSSLSRKWSIWKTYSVEWEASSSRGDQPEPVIADIKPSLRLFGFLSFPPPQSLFDCQCFEGSLWSRWSRWESIIRNQNWGPSQSQHS